MAQTKEATKRPRSSAKRLRQSKKRAIRNKGVKSRLKTLEKNVRQALEAGKIEDAQSQFRTFVSAFDSAASKGITTRNKAARKKSRLSTLLNKTASQAAQ